MCDIFLSNRQRQIDDIFFTEKRERATENVFLHLEQILVIGVKFRFLQVTGIYEFLLVEFLVCCVLPP